jgi:hypothetical protein
MGRIRACDLSDKLVVTGSDALNRVSSFIKQFVSMNDSQLAILALWVAHTHALQAAETTPYLSVTSAEKQCGKTRLLEVLSLLVAKPWFTGSVSKAVLVRKLDAVQPTLLLDETDAAFAGDKEYSEALRAVLNNGHSREGVASLCVGQGANITFKDFQVFCPKAIAGIGRLPDTVADRSIPIRMKRRPPGDKSERFRRRLCQAEASEIRDKLETWINNIVEDLRDAAPGLPNLLSDRQQDGCEPLLAIADIAGGDWPQKGRNALLEILTGEVAEDDSFRVRLLSDIRTVFDQKLVERLSTVDLLAGLCDTEPQWLEFLHGKPVSAAAVARLMRPFGICHRKLRFGEATLWGYDRESFADAWLRYLPRRVEQMEQFSGGAAERNFGGVEQEADVPAFKNKEILSGNRVVPSVPPHAGSNVKLGLRCYVHGTATQWWERPPFGSGEFVCDRCHPKPYSLTAREIGF